MSAMANPRVIDLDAELGYTGEDDDIPFTTVKILGKNRRVLLGMNQFLAVQISQGSTKAIMNGTLQFVHPDDRAQFEDDLQSTSFLQGDDPEEDAKKILAIFNQLAGVAAAPRPTNASSDSRPSSPKRAAVKRSAAASSRRAKTQTG